MRLRRVLIAVPAAAITLTVLAGCVPNGYVVDPGATSTSTPTTTGTSKPTPSASGTAQAPAPGNTVDGEPVTITCKELVSPQAMYDFNPNFSLKADYSPASGSLTAQVTAQKGLACAWVNQTSGALIEIAVAHLPAEHLTDLKNNLVTTSNSVPTYGVEGYFKLNGSTGEAQAFSDPYWIVATSTVFFEPGDAQPLVAAAITALK